MIFIRQHRQIEDPYFKDSNLGLSQWFYSLSPISHAGGLVIRREGENRHTMPRELFDAEGVAHQVPDETELKAYQEAQTKVADLEKQMKELEADTNPDWKGAREKMRTLENEVKDWKIKAEKAGVQVEPKPLPMEDLERIADERAEKVYINRHRDRLLESFGDKKEVVTRFYNKLAEGETLNEKKVEELVLAAARTAGISDDSSPTRRAMASSSTSAPNFDSTPPNANFADTEQGKALGSRLGLTINEAKK